MIIGAHYLGNIKITAVFLMGMLVFTGCNKSGPVPQSAPAPAPPSPISEKIDKLNNQVLFLRFRLDALESGEASISSEDKWYGIANTKFGAFTVSVLSVVPYLDGFKVKLQFGNLTSAHFHGAKITVDWGLPLFDENGPTGNTERHKKKEFTVLNQFSPGSFTNTEVILTPAKPEEVKKLSVGIDLNQLSMR